jgi:hypothetical protein
MFGQTNITDNTFLAPLEAENATGFFLVDPISTKLYADDSWISLCKVSGRQ